jgi:hypothetical protein
MPLTAKAFEAWLSVHPGGLRGAVMLIIAGRLREAEAAMAKLGASTSEEAFELTLVRNRLALLAGAKLDIESLHRAWLDLPPSEDGDHLREDLGLLEARSATDQGQDPLAVLAAARTEVRAINPRMQTRRMLTEWTLSFIATTILMTILVSVIVQPS